MVRKQGQKRTLDNPQTRGKLLRLLREGASDKGACALLPIDQRTFYRSIERDKALAEQIEQAREEGKQLHIKTIFDARKKDWRASAFWLERKYFEEFARRRPEQLGVAQVLTIIMPVITELVAMLPEEQRKSAGERLEIMAEKLQLEAKKSG